MCLNFAYRYRIRASFPDLEIERGRYRRPKTDPKQRMCAWCLEVEDEEHFITRCQISAHERQILYTKVGSKHTAFQNLSNHDQFIFLMPCKDRLILTWLGKFLHKSFDIRDIKRYKLCIPSKWYQFRHSVNGILEIYWVFFSLYTWYSTMILLQVFSNLYQGFLCIDIYCLSGHRNMYICVFVI